MDDDIIDTLRYNFEMSKSRSRKKVTNSIYGRSVFRSGRGSSTSPSMKMQKCRLKVKGKTYKMTTEPLTYENPWDALIWGEWQQRAEEFWDARLQGRVFWEHAKNGSDRRK